MMVRYLVYDLDISSVSSGLLSSLYRDARYIQVVDVSGSANMIRHVHLVLPFRHDWT